MRRATAVSLFFFTLQRYFYPRSPCGERPCVGVRDADLRVISIHALLAESDQAGNVVNAPISISIHALLAESDGQYQTPSHRHRHFYPRSPCGERRDNVKCCCSIRDFYPRSPCGERPTKSGTFGRSLYFYPRSPCGERRLPRCRPGSECQISIHALLAESDMKTMSTIYPIHGISIHALLAESDFNGDHGHIKGDISIHALLAESDVVRATVHTCRDAFLSTLSLRRATMIHPLLCNAKPNFYPRSPCGERQLAARDDSIKFVFLSTLSLRRATVHGRKRIRTPRYFYPRSPCGERPLGAGSVRGISSNFYPRSPCGERLWPGRLARPFFIISIHALLAESDAVCANHHKRRLRFLSTLSLRRATNNGIALIPHQ